VTGKPVLSVIIPCRNDAEFLRRLVPDLVTDPRLQVIVVSADDSDIATTQICKTFGVRHIVRKGSRGLRLRAGAEIAQTQYLWFLHADASITPDAVDAVIDSLKGGAAGGYFKFRFAGPESFQKKVTEVCIAGRCRFGGIPYGDQALFVRKREYMESGGHELLPLFEEVKLVRWLQRSGRFQRLALTVGVNPARWDKDGYALRSFKNRCLAIGKILGVAPHRLARSYYTRR
jgi:glycosyltransferase involved in cell wall biosynthesis